MTEAMFHISIMFGVFIWVASFGVVLARMKSDSERLSRAFGVQNSKQTKADVAFDIFIALIVVVPSGPVGALMFCAFGEWWCSAFDED